MISLLSVPVVLVWPRIEIPMVLLPLRRPLALTVGLPIVPLGLVRPVLWAFGLLRDVVPLRRLNGMLLLDVLGLRRLDGVLLLDVLGLRRLDGMLLLDVLGLCRLDGMLLLDVLGLRRLHMVILRWLAGSMLPLGLPWRHKRLALVVGNLQVRSI